MTVTNRACQHKWDMVLCFGLLPTPLSPLWISRLITKHHISTKFLLGQRELFCHFIAFMFYASLHQMVSTTML